LAGGSLGGCPAGSRGGGKGFAAFGAVRLLGGFALVALRLPALPAREARGSKCLGFLIPVPLAPLLGGLCRTDKPKIPFGNSRLAAGAEHRTKSPPRSGASAGYVALNFSATSKRPPSPPSQPCGYTALRAVSLTHLVRPLPGCLTNGCSDFSGEKTEAASNTKRHFAEEAKRLLPFGCALLRTTIPFILLAF